MNRWTTVETEEFDKAKRTRREGIKIEVSLSPYDVPEAVRGSYCAERKKFIIFFKYLSKEATRPRRISEHISVNEGVRSNRMYEIEIEIDVTALNVEQIQLEVTPILKDFYESLPEPKHRNSSDDSISREGVTGEIIERYRNEIFA